MEFAKKVMVLVPEDRMNRHVIKEPQLTELDTEMAKILNSELPNEVKIKFYQQILNKRNTALGNNSPLDRFDEEEEEPKMRDLSKPPLKKSASSDILLNLPKSHREISGKIISHLKDYPNVIKWSPSGQLVYKGVEIDNTNISELLSSVVSIQKKKPVPGEKEFLQGLYEISLPHYYIRNKKYMKRWLEL